MLTGLFKESMSFSLLFRLCFIQIPHVGKLRLLFDYFQREMRIHNSHFFLESGDVDGSRLDPV